MSVNRKVRIPAAGVESVIRLGGLPSVLRRRWWLGGGRSVPGALGEIAETAGEPAQDRQRDLRLGEDDGLEVPGCECQAGRRTLRDDLRGPRSPVEDGQLSEEVARADRRDGL